MSSLTMVTDYESKLTSLMVMFPEKVADKYFATVREDMLVQDVNKRIYRKCEKLRFDRKAINVESLYEPDLVERVIDGYSAFGSMARIDIAPLIRRLHEDWKYRLLQGMAMDINDMSKTQEEISEIWGRIDETRSKLDIRINESMFTVAELADLYGNEETYNETSKSCLVSGFPNFDKSVIIKPGDLIILAGRPSMGKTDFALLYAKAVAEKGFPVGFVSLEMRGMYLLKRLATSAGHSHQGTDAQKYIKGAEKICGLPIVIDESSKHNISSLRGRTKKMIDQHGIKMLIIDYLTLLDPPKAENRNQEVTKTTRELKYLANDFNIPVMVLAQLNRGVEHRINKRPLLADLRESGAIEQDADIVMFAFRPDYYKVNPDQLKDIYGVKDILTQESIAHYLEILPAKQREGATGVIPFYYDKVNKVLASMAGGKVEYSPMVEEVAEIEPNGDYPQNPDDVPF